ncbi:MAG: hypothetical protein CFE43_21015 [Burkholderiales bacterium PBB3]|nr:MAG: hypothetical protein CFE43_21015 [Burkholderiales bacterium PBB3]
MIIDEFCFFKRYFNPKAHKSFGGFLLDLSDNTEIKVRLMQHPNEHTSDATTTDSGRSDMQLAFAAALNGELDSLGFEKGPGRTSALAKVLGMTRTQPYRILKGLSALSTESMAELRKLGVSFDRIMDRINRISPTSMTVMVNGELISVIVQRAVPGGDCAAALRRLEDGSHSLVSLDPGDTLAEDEIGVQSLQFLARNTLAIVEDIKTERDLLQRAMSNSFKVVAFANAKSLLSHSAGLTRFKAFVIDWGLPDMDCAELITTIRGATEAPIFILTGNTEVSEQIAGLMDYSQVHHATKPADTLILSKRISSAIRLMA